MPPDKQKPSYNDAMAEWSAKQSFFRNPANRFIHPNPDSPLVVRILGYLFRLALVAAIFAGGSLYLLKKNLKGRDFARAMGKNFAEVLKASEDDLDHSGIKWKGGMGRVSRFIAKGGDDAFFHDIELRAIEFKASLLGLFGSNWNFSSIIIDEMKLKLRSGGKVEVDAGKVSRAFPATSALHLVAAGFLSPEPDLAKASYQRIDVRNANLYWGNSKATRGSITGARMAFIPGSDDSHWRLEFVGGLLTQNWWKKVKIRTLTVRREPGKLVFENGRLETGENGEGFLAGEVATGAIPRIDLRLEFANMPAEFVLPPRFSEFTDGVVLAGTDSIKGSVNLKSGVEHHLSVKIQKPTEKQRATVRDFPPLGALSLITEDSAFRRFAITDGSMEAHSREDLFKVKDLSFQSAGLGKIEATLELRDPHWNSDPFVADPQTGQESGTLSRKPGSTIFPISGEMRLGADASAIDESSSPLIGKYLTEERDGFRWLVLTLDGPFEEYCRDLLKRVRRDTLEAD